MPSLRRQTTFFAGLLALVFTALCTCSLSAHPAWGLVVEEDGTLYAADILTCSLGCVWRIDPDGTITKIIEHQHTHMLLRDAEGNLWGTHHAYLSATDEWENLLWKRTPDDTRTVVIPATRDESAFSGTNFALDADGQVYFDHQRRLMRRTPDGKVTLLAGGASTPRDGQGRHAGFQRIQSLVMGPDQHLYVADAGTLRKVALDGTVTTIARGLIEATPDDPPYPDARHNLLFGLFVEQDGSVYVANSGGRRVLHVQPDGHFSVAYRVAAPWFPAGVARLGDALYTLEVAYESGRGHTAIRVQRTDAAGTTHTVATLTAR